MALTTRTVVGTYLYDDLTPATGDVTFVPNAALTSSANTTLVPTSAVTAQLGTNGAFTITLVCTDNAGVSPTGWAYTVTERIDGQAQRSYTINVPAGVGSLDLSTVTPLETVPALVTYLLAANNLSDVASAATARTNLGLTAAATATLPLAIASGGTGQTTASTALSALGGVASTRSVSAGTGLTGGGDLSADRTLAVTFAGASDFPGAVGEFNQVGASALAARSDHSHSGLSRAEATITITGKNGLASITFAGRQATTGAPAAGTWATGDAVLDSAGTWHYCTAGGTPGTWA